MATEKIVAEKITRATAKLFIDAGEAALKEFTLKNNCRADLITLTNSKISIIEVKSSRQDF